MKKGKALEQLVGCIQEFISDTPNKSICVGKRIKDNNGLLREIDVLVETIIQGFSTFMAFECKDYSTSTKRNKVGATVIDAFVGKCENIPQINCKVVVSTTGFTKGAVLKANSNGVFLCNLAEITIDENLFNDETYAGDSEFEIKEMRCIVKDSKDLDDYYELPISQITFINQKITAESIFESCVNRMSAKEYANLAIRFLKNNKKPYCHALICQTKNNPIIAIKMDGKECYVYAIRYSTLVDFKLNRGVVMNNRKFLQGKFDIQATEYAFGNNHSRMIVIRNGDKSRCFTKDSDGYTPFEFYEEF